MASNQIYEVLKLRKSNRSFLKKANFYLVSLYYLDNSAAFYRAAVALGAQDAVAVVKVEVKFKGG